MWHSSCFLYFTAVLEKNTNEHVQICGTAIPIGKTYKKYFAEFLKVSNNK